MAHTVINAVMIPLSIVVGSAVGGTLSHYVSNWKDNR